VRICEGRKRGPTGVVRRNAGSISEDEFARRRNELLGTEHAPFEE